MSKNIGEIAHNASSATGEVSASRCDVYFKGLRLRRYKHSLFSSTLLASCGEAMTKRCELAALVLLQRWVNNWR
ncbi:hypothetical protein [Nostoc sp. 'Peltigera malacea cyanobiont' DB3992]|uniref:hypothetical protein n=1 Tax=Nostoc sp. 'Peltigera malacea cyanobiont' DB3992 TaxID=1206980 RepID=UPI000C04F5C4|nr:hypothetical protein [Nostoc sp. 'Peltigera malacea cyanobiont' DB3992]PHM10980.1 hypothetical protein CK516_05235 [Nostoc sp. 'Peltigera malacea cyanobiont' DB3992]